MPENIQARDLPYVIKDAAVAVICVPDPHATRVKAWGKAVARKVPHTVPTYFVEDSANLHKVLDPELLTGVYPFTLVVAKGNIIGKFETLPNAAYIRGLI